jgi:large conductance mechanosensitive channel
VNAVACALLAWTDAGLGAMLGWAAAIGVAHAIGERFGEPFAAIDTKRRGRMGVFLGTLQVSVLVIALVLAAASPTPGLLGFLVDVFAGYQLLVTVLLRLTTEPRGLVGQSLALTALACLRGGPLGAWAAASSLALAGVYVALDHHARLLAAHRIDDAPHARGALLRGAAVVLPVAVAVGLGIYRVSPLPRPDPPPQTIGDAYKPVEDKPKRELDLRALRALVLSGLGGAVFVYFVGRWLVRSKKGERGVIEAPEPLRGALERIREAPPASSKMPSYAGRRGRVVRAYLDLLRGADRAGFARRPDETAGEFAAALADARRSRPRRMPSRGHGTARSTSPTRTCSGPRAAPRPCSSTSRGTRRSGGPATSATLLPRRRRPLRPPAVLRRRDRPDRLGTDVGPVLDCPPQAVQKLNRPNGGHMLKGFRDFLMRGNVIELAVAVIIGAAFNGVVDGLIKGIIDPLIATLSPGDVKALETALLVGPFRVGLVLSAIVNFLIKAGVVYFFILRPFAAFAARLAAAPAPAPAPSTSETLLTEIRDLLAARK